MAILGNLLMQGIKLRKTIEQDNKPPFALQKRTLLKLLVLSQYTAFAKEYGFDKVIETIRTKPRADKSFYKQYCSQVPIFNYEKIYEAWWSRARNGEKDVAWRGGVKYFALSSGTSGAPSKYIPVTRDMVRAIRRTSIRQILSLINFPAITSKMFSKSILMLGGSTHLNHRGSYFEGDLSGITTGQIPFWFQHFYKPGKRIASKLDWESKLQEIVLNAPKWDIAYVAGSPTWMQVLFERIIQHYQVKTIHDIWPNLVAYAYGGVSFVPYKKAFARMSAKPITMIETYLASEGFIAFQDHPDRNLRLVLNNGIFHEFIPFTEENFDDEGELKGNPTTLMVDEIEIGVDYAILLSTCAGSWRYLIGDTIRFTNKERCELIITGRTKHYLSLCGEHLSVDNMNQALEIVSEELNISCVEFTVVGIPYDTLFAHQWYIGTDDVIDESVLKERLDQKLKDLNDDYRVERTAGLKDIFVKVVSPSIFYQWLALNGKAGGQNKFPRVLKKKQYQEWLQFLKEQSII